MKNIIKMKYLKKAGKVSLLFSSILMLVITSCTKDDDINPDDTAATVKYGINLRVGDTEYLVSTDNPMDGNITAVGQGAETRSFGSAIAVGKYLYMRNLNDNTIDQMEMASNGYQKVASISMASILPNGFRDISEIESGKLLFTSWPDDNNVVSYAFINVPAFSVEKSGTFDVPTLDDYVPVELGGPGMVSNGKIYFGTMYSNRVTWDTRPDSLVTLAYDYPSFTNPKFLFSTASLGATSSYQEHSMIKDEKGDIYQVNIRSKHWYGMGTVEDKPTVINKISNGAYDNSYTFNISDNYSGTVSLIGMQYAGNGIAYGRLGDEDATNEWGVFAGGNNTTIVKIDLYNKTIKNMNLPKGPVRFGRMGLYNGKVYWAVSPENGDAYVYEIDPTGGTDAFTRGAQLDGGNVVVQGIYVHPMD